MLSVAPDGTACNDGNSCTTGDACLAGGCAGQLVDNGLRVNRLAPGSATSVITWNLPSGATGSDVVRGHLSCLPVSPTGVCETPLAQNLTGSTSVQDTGVPVSGDSYWYLVRGRNTCAPGPWGFEAANGLATLAEVSNGGCVPSPSASPRYVDNGLTVTDLTTCLEWEKKTTSAGVNNVNNLYAWTQSGIADGTAFSVFLPTLNAGRFARHTGWRLPSEEGKNPPFTGPKELESILNCGFNPCIDPIFGQTASSDYWSSSSHYIYPYDKWAVDFLGFTTYLYFTDNVYVRAVRGGP